MINNSNFLNLKDQKPDPNFKKGRGYIYLFFGLITLYLGINSPEYLYKMILAAVILGLFGYFHIADYEGVIFDFNRKCIKKYWAIAGIEIGRWEQVLTAKMIVLDKKNTKSSVTNIIGRLDFNSDHVSQTFRICISYKTSEKFDFIIHFKDYKTALKNGLWLAEKLNLPLENRIEKN